MRPDRLPADIANWKGAWATSTNYIANDAVSNDGGSYICTLAHTSAAGSEPGTGGSWATYWDLMADKGSDGVAGQLVGSGAWTTATGYTADVDVVENDGSGYVCKATHTSGALDDEPGVGAVWETYWELLVSKGDTGTKGDQGEFGGDSFEYAFSTTTAKADPGSGILRYNHATPSSATEIYLDILESNAVDISAWLAALDDSTSTIKGRIRVFKKTDSSVFATFNITAITDETGYYTLAVTYVTGNSTFADTDDIIVTFAFTGDKGATGAGAQTPWSSEIDGAGHGVSDVKTLDFSDATTVTIASGVAALTQANHMLETESAAATDDVDTINGLGNGEVAFLRAADGTHTVVLKHGTGNIVIPGDADYSLDDTTKTVQVIGDGTNVHLVGAAGGGVTEAEVIYWARRI